MFNLPFLCWKDEWLILPPLRTAVAWAATCCAWLSVLMAVFALAALGLLYAGMPQSELLAWVSYCMGVLLFAGTLLLVPWCLVVLTAGRGSYLSRPFAVALAGAGVLYAVCVGYSQVTGELLLPLQGVLPFMAAVVILPLFSVNWGRMTALPHAGRLRLPAAYVLYMLSLIGDNPVIYEAGVLFKIACCWALFSPLRALAAMAPRIIGLPPIDAENDTPRTV